MLLIEVPEHNDVFAEIPRDPPERTPARVQSAPPPGGAGERLSSSRFVIAWAGISSLFPTDPDHPHSSLYAVVNPVKRAGNVWHHAWHGCLE